MNETRLSKPEVSKKSNYYIPKHRYYELKHFCLQFKDWKRYLADYEGRYPNQLMLHSVFENKLHCSDPTAYEVERRAYFNSLINTVNKACTIACEDESESIRDCLFEGVTEGLSYDILLARYNIPCGREYYYKVYRRFFWVLDQLRK